MINTYSKSNYDDLEKFQSFKQLKCVPKWPKPPIWKSVGFLKNLQLPNQSQYPQSVKLKQTGCKQANVYTCDKNLSSWAEQKRYTQTETQVSISQANPYNNR